MPSGFFMDYLSADKSKDEKNEQQVVDDLLLDHENRRRFVGFFDLLYKIADREGLLEDD